MDFNELYKSMILSEKRILELVDEYTLYSFYTNIDPLIIGKAYNAPYYRQDNYPSFSIYESKYDSVEYMWKDHATGEAGNIFKLIQKIETLSSRQEVISRINEDFALGYNSSTPPERRDKIMLYERPEFSEVKIRIQAMPLNVKGRAFWDPFRIQQDRLDFYSTVQVQHYWLHERQEAPTTAIDPTFSYRIGDYHQLYSPFAAKHKKFRNDLPENYFFGYLQLPQTGKVLVIDKSCKDVLFCDRIGFPAVCGKSETTMIPGKKMLEFKDRFETVYLTLDPDKAGRDQTAKYMSLYPWLKPRFLTEAKDKTDLCKAVGFEKAERTIKEMLNG